MKTFRVETKVNTVTIVIIESPHHETILDEISRTLDRMETDPDHNYVTTLVMVDDDSR